MEEKKLIYDIGLHLGYDTQMYLEKGYKVIAVEANPLLVEKANKKFRNYILQGDLILVNKAISDKDNENISFYICDSDAQSSMIKGVAERFGNSKEVKVHTIRLSTLFEEYGRPYYCKIDIEGYDHVALDSLSQNTNLPLYISAENENTSKSSDDLKELEHIWTSILEKQKSLGYKRFKIVDQRTLKVLNSNFTLYKNPFFLTNITAKLYCKISRLMIVMSSKLSLNWGYLTDCSGPFGEELGGGNWLNIDEARHVILNHGKAMREYGIKSMWCDIHATF